MDTAFQADAFQNDAFQIAAAEDGVLIPGMKRRIRMHVEPPMEVEVTDDGWIHILL